uniref:Secreted protein n=1 Tax=Steinernema glaseri TaxID=37863 RepID=A0A1I7ZIU6_9BILA
MAAHRRYFLFSLVLFSLLRPSSSSSTRPLCQFIASRSVFTPPVETLRVQKRLIRVSPLHAWSNKAGRIWKVCIDRHRKSL